LADQVLETVLGHFAIHSVAAASLYDVPAVAEATWHGACLACAEMTRRGVVSSERVPELVGWLSKVFRKFVSIFSFMKLFLGPLFRLAKRISFGWIQCSRRKRVRFMGFGQIS
jgi:hypothetical protein